MNKLISKRKFVNQFQNTKMKHNFTKEGLNLLHKYLLEHIEVDLIEKEIMTDIKSICLNYEQTTIKDLKMRLSDDEISEINFIVYYDDGSLAIYESY